MSNIFFRSHVGPIRAAAFHPPLQPVTRRTNAAQHGQLSPAAVGRSLFLHAYRSAPPAARPHAARARLLQRLLPTQGVRGLSGGPPLPAGLAQRLWVLAEEAAVLCRAPRGFGKFYDKGKVAGGEAKPAKGSTPKADPARPSKGGDGGGGSGSGDGGPKGAPGDKGPSWVLQAGAAASALILINMLLPSNNNGAGQPQEISWQSFKTDYLEPGRVEKVVVSNRTVAKVFVRQVMHFHPASPVHCKLRQWRLTNHGYLSRRTTPHPTCWRSPPSSTRTFRRRPGASRSSSTLGLWTTLTASSTTRRCVTT
jgi:hypothetical protein